LLQREIPEEINIKACKIAIEKGVKVVLDMGGADTPLSMELLGLLNIVSPNKTELKRILNCNVNVDDQTELLKALEQMRSLSNNPELCLLLKLGSKGCIYIDKENKIYTQKAFHFDDMPIQDTTGAGNLILNMKATVLQLRLSPGFRRVEILKTF